MQHPRAGVSRSTDASSAHASNSSVGADLQLQSVLEAVPAYCCTADLLSKATPQLTALVASLTATDISRLMTYTFYEVVVLLEFTSRKVPHPAPEAAAAWAAAPPAADDPQQTTSWPFLQHESELQAVVDRFFGLLTIVMATNPMPLIQAMCLNHRTQQQETPPPDHWEVSQHCSVHACVLILCSCVTTAWKHCSCCQGLNALTPERTGGLCPYFLSAHHHVSTPLGYGKPGNAWCCCQGWEDADSPCSMWCCMSTHHHLSTLACRQERASWRPIPGAVG